jgi:hypothetical protein
MNSMPAVVGVSLRSVSRGRALSNAALRAALCHRYPVSLSTASSAAATDSSSLGPISSSAAPGGGSSGAGPSTSDGAGGSGGRPDAFSTMSALLKLRSDAAALKDLKIGPLLGRGSYGRVYRGEPG